MLNMGIFWKEKWSILHGSMKTKIMETSITSEMVSQNTICREMKGSSKDHEFLEIAKKFPQAPSKDKEHDKNQNSEGITEIEQTGKNVNKAREAYFNFIQTQRKRMTHMKRTAKKRIVREGQDKCRENKSQQQGMCKKSIEKPRKRIHQFRPVIRPYMKFGNSRSLPSYWYQKGHFIE